MTPLRVECLEPEVRRSILVRLWEYLGAGYLDPEMLYWGGRFALSLGLRKEALKFLQPLATRLLEGADAAPAVDGPDGSWQIVAAPKIPFAYGPVALLLLAALSDDDEKRRPVIERLRFLAERESNVAREPVVVDALNSDSTVTTAGLLRKLLNDGELDWVPKAPQPVASIIDARAKYDEGRLDDARAALETALLGRTDELAVLANLVIVTSEQSDIEAYERYWRRLVRMALFCMLRGDRAPEARAVLESFYVRVAEATEQQCGGKPNEVVALLRRPGFLSRWLESHAALVWLDAFHREGFHQQTRLGPDVGLDRLGELSLFRAWVEIFHPDFSCFILPSKAPSNSSTLLTAPGFESTLPFEPGHRLVRRMLEWSQYQFGIKGERDGRHVETVCAFAMLVARLPKSRYLRDLAKAMGPEILKDRTIDRAVRDACSLPFQLRLSRYLGKDGPDWEGLTRLLPDPDLRAGVAADLQLFFALGMTELGRRVEGLEAACLAMEHFDADDLAEGSQARNLLLKVIKVAIGGVVSDKDIETVPELAKMFARVDHVPITDATREIRNELLDLLRRAKEQIELNQQIDTAMERLKQHMAKHEFDRAVGIVRCLPDSPAQVAELKKSLLSQIEEAKESHLLHSRIETTLEKVKQYVAKQEFDHAVEVVGNLPDSPAQVAELKERLLSQIAEAEESHLLHRRIETTLERVKQHVAKQEFGQAVGAVRGLPNSPAQVVELKESLLSQIAEAEESHLLHRRIEVVIENVKQHMGRSDLDGAIAAVRGLPDSPPQVVELKNQLFGQIEEGARMMGESQELLRRFQRRGIGIDVIRRIARDNNVNPGDPMQLYGLLKALERQL